MLWGTPAGAGEWEYEASVAAELRFFPHDPLFPEQRDATVSPSIAIEPALRYTWNDGLDRLTLAPFARYDAHDRERTHFDVREASWRHIGGAWDVTVGASKVFWGVTESVHLVDIVNQTDLVEDVDGEDKLGQPMIAGNIATEWGRFGAFVMPFFRERTFPDRRARLRGLVPIEVDDARYEADAGRFHPDIALRYARSVGGLDLGLAYFRGTGREPRLVPELRDGAVVAVPHYDLIDQGSIDAQYTVGGWLLKLEALARGGQGRTFAALVGGFEYTFFNALGSDVDVGLLAEYLYDGRDDSAPETPFEDDVFFGARIALNDVQDTNLLVGAIVDRGDGGTFVSLEFERRLGNLWKVEVEGRFFANVAPADPVYGIRRDDHVKLRLLRYF